MKKDCASKIDISVAAFNMGSTISDSKRAAPRSRSMKLGVPQSDFLHFKLSRRCTIFFGFFPLIT
uniref:Uncharacterized protein n=1 Tax=Rhizophora mucronata TaxID=61149 RepID=A0A2P2JWF4_RHIMU